MKFKTSLVGVMALLSFGIGTAVAQTVPPEIVKENRALLIERWQGSMDDIAHIIVAGHCGIVPELSATVASRRVAFMMDDQKNYLGLIDDPASQTAVFYQKALAMGRELVKTTDCSVFTPAQRASIRQWIAALEASYP